MGDILCMIQSAQMQQVNILFFKGSVYMERLHIDTISMTYAFAINANGHIHSYPVIEQLASVLVQWWSTL